MIVIVIVIDIRNYDFSKKMQTESTEALGDLTILTWYLGMVKAQDFITIIGEPDTFGQAAARVGLFEQAMNLAQQWFWSAVDLFQCLKEN